MLKLFNLKSAIAVQPLIRQTLEREYLGWSDTVVREGFNKQAKRIERAFKQIGNIPKRFQQLTEDMMVYEIMKSIQNRLKTSTNLMCNIVNDHIYNIFHSNY